MQVKNYTLPANDNEEIQLYGLAAGAEDWQEDLLATKCRTAEDVQRVVDAASADGFHSFRISKFVWGDTLDFTKTVNL